MERLVHKSEMPRRSSQMDGDFTGALSELPFFSIIIPVLNEENYIEACVMSLLHQVPIERGEILIVDGGSTDCTKQIVERLKISVSNILLLDNPRRYQSSAINLAAERASPRSEILIRADAHAEYPDDFVIRIVQAFQTTKASSVVVPMRAVGRGGFQDVVAAIQNSSLGTGGAAHRIGKTSRYVDHGHHAGFDRAIFKRLGGYNPDFSHNEDAEYDYRVIQSGGCIWLCCEAIVVYFPRNNIPDLIKQYFRFGSGRMQTILLHRGIPRLRQILPVLLLMTNALTLILSPLFPALLLAPAAYLLLCTAWSAVLAPRDRGWRVLGGVVAAAAMHHAWATGALNTLIGHFWQRLHK